jgi:tricorn protease
VRFKLTFISFVLLSICIALPAFADEARLLRQPTVSADSVAFVYANDIWVVPRTGGEARRLTTFEGAETDPVFSPDGKYIAFTGQYDGNTDVFVVPTIGGEPKRLTYHPYPDSARGWTPDGKRVIFASGRTSVPIPFARLWSVSVEGGQPEPLPMSMADRGVYSPDGRRMAYVRLGGEFDVWRHYRGGATTEIWLLNIADYSLEKVPRVDNCNDAFPAWIGNKVYFISDRNHTFNLFSYDTTSKEVKQLTSHDDYDIRCASGGAGVIVYEQAGWLYIFDPAVNEAKKLSVELQGDLPWRRPHFTNVSDLIWSGDVSPNGKRAVFQARGDIFTVPAEKGDYRDLTRSCGANDRFPAWSPDGKWIAWFSDGSGEYQLMVIDQMGNEAPRTIALENPSYYYAPTWSPDSKKIVFTDKHLNLWYVDVESGKAVKVDKDTFDHPDRSLNPVWSPDSRWLAYSKRMRNQQHAIFLYSLTDAKSYQLTDGLSDAISPAFDMGGKYLYFLASTNYALNVGWLDMTSYERPVTRGVYLVVLNSEDPSPLLPESDEEEVKAATEEKKPEAAEKREEKKEEKLIRIDLQGIGQRILAVDVPLRDYGDLKAGEENTFFYAESIPNQQGVTLHRYDLKKRKDDTFMGGVDYYKLSATGKKLLYFSGGTWGIVDTAGNPKPGDGRLDTASLQMKVDPLVEWAQIYREGWRIDRDYFYDPKMHGTDWNAVYKKYEPLVKYVGHRSDLSYILQMMISELTCGHSWAAGGDLPDVKTVRVGLLGADFTIENGFYKIARIYTGESWNPGLSAPLCAPGLNVKPGDYLLEVNGSELKAPTNVYRLLENTAGKQITIRVNDKPTLEGARLLTVVPAPSEFELRRRAWVEDNRRKVDEMSGGKLAYVYLPNTAGDGYTYFNRYYFAQEDKPAAIIDERFNGGGSVADYFVDMMNRPVLSYWATRDGEVFASPAAAIFGPKVMIINEYAGSGGDALPYYFRKRGIGPLIGKTTWGGLVGHHEGVQLIDGGYISSPNLAIFNTDGKWDVENKGVHPDIEIEMTPALEIAGHDPQLERAVQEALKLLAEHPVVHPPRPASDTERSHWRK